jgi:hypothetical protein
LKTPLKAAIKKLGANIPYNPTVKNTIYSRALKTLSFVPL